ncbi:MAG: hypothetical protein ACREHV_01075 [Rhizomicrobium sp.]
MGESPTLPAHVDKKKVDIEALVQWTYLEELPKRQISSAEGIWDRLAAYGSLGGVNPDVSHFAGGGAQRYAQFGLPHPDAEAIEKAVAQLGSVAVDWARDFHIIAAELAELVDISGVGGPHGRFRAGPADSGYTRGSLEQHIALDEFNYIKPHHEGKVRVGLRARAAFDRPRDVIAVSSINLPALVQTHALKRSRPQWQNDSPVPVPVHSGRGFAIVGECRGKNLYTEGSHCPLAWSPSPLSIVLERAEYFLWHQALTTLAETLELNEHEATKPAASAAPWIEGEETRPPIKQTADRKGFLLPFPSEAERPRAGPPLRFSKYSEVRHPLLDNRGN